MERRPGTNRGLSFDNREANTYVGFGYASKLSATSTYPPTNVENTCNSAAKSIGSESALKFPPLELGQTGDSAVLTSFTFIQLRKGHTMTAEEKHNQAAPVAEAPAAEPAPALPDYVLDENAVLKDVINSWRHGRAPDYSRTRKVYAESLSTTSTVHPNNH